MRLLYLVHNLNDPGVAKRVAMLETAGIETLVAGFWREFRAPPKIGKTPAISLGESFDARFLHRAFISLKNAFQPDALVKAAVNVDLVMARNLEMLAIAAAVGKRLRVPLVYEVLDVHRLMLGGKGCVLRSIERRLMHHVTLVLVSSPAFLKCYFERFQFGAGNISAGLIENKLVELESAPLPSTRSGAPPGPPWRIGWLGMLRCRKTLAILSRLAARRPDLVRIEIFGRPSKEVSEDLKGALPEAINFGGAYQQSQLADLYGRMHFNWAIDYFEEGLNSRWLLPNRIYEGGRHDVVPLAEDGTETAQWLKGLGLGVLMNDPERELESFLDGLTPEAYRDLKQASMAAPRRAFIADRDDCNRLGSLLRAARGDKEPALALTDEIALP